jgi:very-short-patch-repair endonuclease
MPQSRIGTAQNLRRRMTDAERMLWRRLRNCRLGGHKFRRQHPIDRYIVDFCCEKGRLVIEVDGGQHSGSVSDVHRTKVIESCGYRVFRLWNNEVLANTDDVLVAILAELEKP